MILKRYTLGPSLPQIPRVTLLHAFAQRYSAKGLFCLTCFVWGGRHLEKVVSKTMDATLIAKGKDRGYLLSEEIIAVFPRVEDDLKISRRILSNPF